MSDILITGSGSGLGKYLHEILGGVGFDRKSCLPKEAEVIIHCAFSSARDYTEEEKVKQLSLEDLTLARDLIRLPHSYFIFISSIDVLKADNAYALSKKRIEDLVKEFSEKYLIIRPSVLLGKYSRPNSLIRIIEGECKLSLTADSVFNYILYEDIANFIKFAIKNRIQGIYNLASNRNIILEDAEMIIRDYLGETKIRYGEFRYNCGEIDISETLKTGAFPNKTSAQVVDQFINII